MNVFARESQINIMAAKAKVDPLELRLKNATDPRLTYMADANTSDIATAPRIDGNMDYGEPPGEHLLARGDPCHGRAAQRGVD